MADNIPAGAIPVTQFEAAQETPPPGAIPVDDFEAHNAPDGAIPVEHFEPHNEHSQYETPGQQLLTGVEGAGQGVIGPLATGLELGAHKLGVDSMMGIDTSAEAMKARAEANPVIHGVSEAGALAASMFSGVGEAGLVAKGAGKVVPQFTGVMGKMGSAAIRGFIEGGMIQGGDEISKAMLGQGNPEAPVSSALAHMGGAALLSAGTAGLFNGLGQAANKGIAALENAKMGDQAQNVLIGMGLATKAHAAGIPEKEAKAFITNYFRDLGVGPQFDYRKYKVGVDAYYGGINKALAKGTGLAADGIVGTGVGSVFGPSAGFMAAGASHKYIAPIVEKIAAKPLVGITNRLAIPTIMKALSMGQTTGLFNALNYSANVAKGTRLIGKGVESVLKAGSQQSVNAVASERDRQKIIDYLDAGGIQKEMQDSLQEAPPQDEDAPGFADGGEVPPEADSGSISTLYPDQDMMMNAARGRVANYLASLQPIKNPSKLPFDRAPETSEAHRNFDSAVNLAAVPLSILNHIKDGTLRAEQVKHFSNMYPELHKHLSQKFTEGIMKAQLDEEQLPYSKRIALSLFLGTALDSTMTQPSIMAAQQVFAPKAPPPQPGGKKNSPSKLGKEVKSYKTADQAAEADRTSRK